MTLSNEVGSLVRALAMEFELNMDIHQLFCINSVSRGEYLEELHSRNIIAEYAKKRYEFDITPSNVKAIIDYLKEGPEYKLECAYRSMMYAKERIEEAQEDLKGCNLEVVEIVERKNELLTELMHHSADRHRHDINSKIISDLAEARKSREAQGSVSKEQIEKDRIATAEAVEAMKKAYEQAAALSDSVHKETEGE